MTLQATEASKKKKETFYVKINNILKRHKSLLVAGGYKLRLKLGKTHSIARDEKKRENNFTLCCTNYVKTSSKTKTTKP